MLVQRKLLLLSAILLFGFLACAPSDGDANHNNSSTEKNSATGFKPDGMAVYRKYCVTCHGADGKLGLNGAKDLSASQLTKAERAQQIAKGKNLMTPFEGILTPEEIEAVAEFTLELGKPVH